MNNEPYYLDNEKSPISDVPLSIFILLIISSIFMLIFIVLSIVFYVFVNKKCIVTCPTSNCPTILNQECQECNNIISVGNVDLNTCFPNQKRKIAVNHSISEAPNTLSVKVNNVNYGTRVIVPNIPSTLTALSTDVEFVRNNTTSIVTYTALPGRNHLNHTSIVPDNTTSEKYTVFMRSIGSGDESVKFFDVLLDSSTGLITRSLEHDIVIGTGIGKFVIPCSYDNSIVYILNDNSTELAEYNRSGVSYVKGYVLDNAVAANSRNLVCFTNANVRVVAYKLYNGNVNLFTKEGTTGWNKQTLNTVSSNNGLALMKYVDATGAVFLFMAVSTTSTNVEFFKCDTSTIDVWTSVGNITVFESSQISLFYGFQKDYFVMTCSGKQNTSEIEVLKVSTSTVTTSDSRQYTVSSVPITNNKYLFSSGTYMTIDDQLFVPLSMQGGSSYSEVFFKYLVVENIEDLTNSLYSINNLDDKWLDTDTPVTTLLTTTYDVNIGGFLLYARINELGVASMAEMFSFYYASAVVE